jgi:hypothetical protein
MFGHLFTFIIGIKIIDTFFYKQYNPSSFMNAIGSNIQVNNQGIAHFIEEKRNKTSDFLKLFSKEFQPYIYKNHHNPDPESFSEFNILFLLL